MVYFAVTFGQDYLRTLCSRLTAVWHALFLPRKKSLSVPSLRLFAFQLVKFLWGISLDSCLWTMREQSRVVSEKWLEMQLLEEEFFPFQSRETLLSFFWRLSDVLECSANTSRHQEASNFGLNYLCKLALCSQLVCIIIFPAQSPSTIPICQNCNCNCRTFFGLHYCSMLSNVKMQNRKVRRKKKIQLCRSTLA